MKVSIRSLGEARTVHNSDWGEVIIQTESGVRYYLNEGPDGSLEVRVLDGPILISPHSGNMILIREKGRDSD